MLVATIIKYPSTSGILLFGCKRHVEFAIHRTWYRLVSEVAFNSTIYDHVEKAMSNFHMADVLSSVEKAALFLQCVCHVTRLLQRCVTFATWQ